MKEEKRLYMVQFGGSLKVEAGSEAEALVNASYAFRFANSEISAAKNLGLRVAGSKAIAEVPAPVKTSESEDSVSAGVIAEAETGKLPIVGSIDYSDIPF